MVARAVLALTLLAVASHTSAQTPASPLLDLTKQYLAAAKARDAAKVASFYAEDGEKDWPELTERVRRQRHAWNRLGSAPSVGDLSQGMSQDAKHDEATGGPGAAQRE
jgi:hypothetical protein